MGLNPDCASTAMRKLCEGGGRRPILLLGEPGVGKSAIVADVASALGWDFIESHPVAMEPVDLTGLPWMSNGDKEARFRVYGDLARVLRSVKPTIWCLDDVGHCRESVQASLMHLAHARRINEHTLPDCVRVVATSNRRGDRGASSRILGPFRSRFMSISVEPDTNQWLSWAESHGVHASVVAYLWTFPDHLSSKADTMAATEDVSSSPRGWHIVSDVIQARLPQTETEAVINETLGPIGSAFTRYLRALHHLPNYADVFAGKEVISWTLIPVDLMMAVMTAFIRAADMGNPSHTGAVTEAIARVKEAGFAEVAEAASGIFADREKEHSNAA